MAMTSLNSLVLFQTQHDNSLNSLACYC